MAARSIRGGWGFPRSTGDAHGARDFYSATCWENSTALVIPRARNLEDQAGLWKLWKAGEKSSAFAYGRLMMDPEMRA